MRLYHYTVAENPLLIRLRGLEPSIHNDKRAPGAHDYQTMGQPVVWLTREETNTITEATIGRCRELTPDSDLAIGDPLFGGPVRITVNIERHNRKLIKYTTFLETTELVAVNPETGERSFTGRDVLKWSRAHAISGVDQWWLYFDMIEPHKIQFVPGWPPGVISAGMALPGAEYNAINAGDEGARKRYAEMAAELRGLEPDCPVEFNIAA